MTLTDCLDYLEGGRERGRSGRLIYFYLGFMFCEKSTYMGTVLQ
jgi:hypothetical protein